MISRHFAVFLSYGSPRVKDSCKIHCFGAEEAFAVSDAAAAQLQSFTHSSYCTSCRCCKWWKRLVVLPLLDATVLLHPLQTTCSCCSSFFLKPIHFYIMEPLFLLLKQCRLPPPSCFLFYRDPPCLFSCEGAAGEGMRRLCTRRLKHRRLRRKLTILTHISI